MSTAAVIVAAGRGTRAGGEIPKQWQQLAGKTVLAHAVEAFRASPLIGRIVVVLHADEVERGRHALSLAPGLGGVTLVAGGTSRAASVRAGLEALVPSPPARVLIHDAARPCVDEATIGRVIAALDHHAGAAPGLEVTDALWGEAGGVVQEIRDRTGLYRAQTPQGFRFDAILAAHRGGAADAADDVAVARAAGLDVAIVRGDEENLKITRPADFARAAHVLQRRAGAMDIRTGNGFDVHRFGPGDHLWLCGVRLAHGRGLQGHSDADVGMHAVTDAIYGALALGDIGRHFPPSDPQWKGAASHIFLKHAAGLVRNHGFILTHADCTLVCEHPKIGPHAIAMQAELARIIGVDADRISVKATTSERLGFTGREEGIAALATATLVRA